MSVPVLGGCCCGPVVRAGSPAVLRRFYANEGLLWLNLLLDPGAGPDGFGFNVSFVAGSDKRAVGFLGSLTEAVESNALSMLGSITVFELGTNPLLVAAWADGRVLHPPDNLPAPYDPSFFSYYADRHGNGALSHAALVKQGRAFWFRARYRARIASSPPPSETTALEAEFRKARDWMDDDFGDTLREVTIQSFWPRGVQPVPSQSDDDYIEAAAPEPSQTEPGFPPPFGQWLALAIQNNLVVGTWPQGQGDFVPSYCPPGFPPPPYWQGPQTMANWPSIFLNASRRVVNWNQRSIRYYQGTLDNSAANFRIRA